MDSSSDRGFDSASAMVSDPKEHSADLQVTPRDATAYSRPADCDSGAHQHENNILVDQTRQRDHLSNDTTEMSNKTQLLSLSPTSGSTKLGLGSAGNESKAPNLDERQSNEDYMDPTPKTPRQEISPSRTQENAAAENKVDEGDPTPELQSIMDQFDDGVATGEETDDEDSQQDASNLNTPLQHPPRRSSLEPLISTRPLAAYAPTDNHRIAKNRLESSGIERGAPTRSIVDSPALGPNRTSSQSSQMVGNNASSTSSPHSAKTLPRLPPSGPDPEPDLPFDFHRFLEQLRHRTADPVAKFLRSFLNEFGKKQWMVHEQEKIIRDFLTFISNRMAQCEIWRGVSDAEFDNAKEGMEKLVMNRLYSQTFSPAIPAPVNLQGSKSKRKNADKSMMPGRKGQHQEDIERDEILGQKVRIYGWIKEEHLDIPPVGGNGRRFLVLAQQGMSCAAFKFLRR